MKRFKPIQMTCFALTILSICWIVWMIFCIDPKEVQTQKQVITNEVQTKSDSVALSVAAMPDSAKLRKLQALKVRIATARFNDSIQRIKHK